jgi:uncharacterized membrane protein (UPF0127 family)
MKRETQSRIEPAGFRILRVMSRILINEQSKAVVVGNLLVAVSTLDRMRGLLGCSSLPHGTGLLIRPCRSIHMWFMRFPIDAAFLDSDLRVLKIARNLKPWQLGFAPKRTHCVLEMAAGELATISCDDRLIEA